VTVAEGREKESVFPEEEIAFAACWTKKNSGVDGFASQEGTYEPHIE